MHLLRAHRAWILAAWLLCQVLSFAHVTQHAGVEFERDCVLCVHSPGLDAGATAATSTTLALSVADPGVSTAPRLVIAASPRTHAPIRGPPAFIV